MADPGAGLSLLRLCAFAFAHATECGHHHTGHIGGIKEATFEEMIARRPERVIEIAVKGMLPKGPLGRAMYRKLKVYAGNEHNHAAQQPQVLDI